MHEKAKKRLKDNPIKPDNRPELLKYLPKEGSIYINFKNAIKRMSEEILKGGEVSVKEAKKIQWLRSRLDFEL